MTATYWPQWVLIVSCAVLAVLSPPTRSPDARLRQQALQRLASANGIAKHQIDVRVSGRVATVTGRVPDTLPVLAVVRGTPGVLDVIDDLRIDDDVVQKKVEEALRADPLVSAVPIVVRSVDGEVTLSSNETNADQRRRIVELASHVQGVAHVVDAMK